MTDENKVGSVTKSLKSHGALVHLPNFVSKDLEGEPRKLSHPDPTPVY